MKITKMVSFEFSISNDFLSFPNNHQFFEIAVLESDFWRENSNILVFQDLQVFKP